VIISASFKRRRLPNEPIPALERFDGVSFRVLRKYLREGKLKNTDVVIVSPEHGILRSNDTIPYDKPTLSHGTKGSGTWQSAPEFDNEQARQLRERNLSQLKSLIDRGKYVEIYVNLGRKFLALVDGFEKSTDAPVIYATGKGLGPKAHHMKNWILGMSDPT
jgi:hypothetical protein